MSVFQSFLTPLRSSFSSAPPTPAPNVLAPPSAEEDARDAMAELMRIHCEELRVETEDVARLRCLNGVLKVMREEPSALPVFREADGFLTLLNILSSLPSLEVLNLVFLVLDGALGDQNNSSFFRTKIGWDSLQSALLPLSTTVLESDSSLDLNETIFIHLLCLLISNFTSPCILLENQNDPHELDIDIVHPEPIQILFSLFLNSDSRYAERLMEVTLRLLTSSHWNASLVSSQSHCIIPILLAFPATSKTKSDLLRQLFEMGIPSASLRTLIRLAVPDGHSVRDKGDGEEDWLALLRTGMKPRWPTRLVFKQGGAVEMVQSVSGGLESGFTFSMWISVSRLSSNSTLTLFGILPVTSVPNSWVLRLSLRSDGKLSYTTSQRRDEKVLQRGMITIGRWTHIVLSHAPTGGVTKGGKSPIARVYIDGTLIETLDWVYPLGKNTGEGLRYVLGDSISTNKTSGRARSSSSLSIARSARRGDKASPGVRWSLSTASLLSTVLDPDTVLFIHHLGPRYTATYTTPDPIRLLTYEASTSLSLYIHSSPQQHPKHALSEPNSLQVPKPSSSLSPQTVSSNVNTTLSALVTNGFPLTLPPSVLFSLKPSLADNNRLVVPNMVSGGNRDKMKEAQLSDEGVVAIDGNCMDDALWDVGGVAVLLRVVEVAKDHQELADALGILMAALKNNWRNSEEMETIHGFEILGTILRSKAHLIDMDAFHVIFTFLGCKYRWKQQSVISNSLAYLVIALDFQLWANTSPAVQAAYFDHFTLLLKESDHARFNAKRKMGKLGVVRKALFALRCGWFERDEGDVEGFINAIRVVLEANFSPEEGIKPVVSFIAAYLHEEPHPAGSPQSMISATSILSIVPKMQSSNSRKTATLLLAALVSVLSSSRAHLLKYISTLPFARTSFLLLGERPTPEIAVQVLKMLKQGLEYKALSYIKKIEGVNGWLVLKHVLSRCWGVGVQVEVFDILLGRFGGGSGPTEPGDEEKVVCPQVFSAITAALTKLMDGLTPNAMLEEGVNISSSPSDQQLLISLVEELIALHTANAAFRKLFKSNQTTAGFANGYRSIVTRLANEAIGGDAVKALEKLNHFVLALALDEHVDSSQKRSLMNTVQKSQKLCGLADAGDSEPIAPQGKAIERAVTAAAIDIVGQRTYEKSASRLQGWRDIVVANEGQRYWKSVQDLRERHRSLHNLGGWRVRVLEAPGIWAVNKTPQLWQLDLTEGPFRVRKRLEPYYPDLNAPGSLMNLSEPEVTTGGGGETDAESFVAVPPWADKDAHEDDSSFSEKLAEDKHRRVRYALEPGDVIEVVLNVTRVVGVDSTPALLILGKSNLYMFDGFVETATGELIDARDAPADAFALPNSTTARSSRPPQNWTYDECFKFSKKTCLFRDVALEIYFRDCQNVLLVFHSKQERHKAHRMIHDKLESLSSMNISRSSLTLRSPLIKNMSSRIASGLGGLGIFGDEVSTAQRRWQAREISNFAYLSILNQASGRTPSDATQYPTFPWVLNDYTSTILDLSSPDTFRDLSKPMGALTEARRKAARTRYENLESVNEAPFHYGTHFSSAMIVCHFLIRTEPFTHMFKTLQGGDWDLPDRLFSEVARAYESASTDSRGDVRELIGEFFTCPEFLENLADLDLGILQSTGKRIHDVVLPPWAKNDPFLFICLHRQALESEHVSENLHHWIDLIWGSKQRNKNALNCFPPLSYEGSIDIDKISDEVERQATVGIIHNFGQTPRKLFDQPHPSRMMNGVSTLPVGTAYGIEENADLLVQSVKPARIIMSPVTWISIDMMEEKILPCHEGVLYVPDRPHEHLNWRGPDGALRLYVDGKIVQVSDHSICTCASTADTNIFATGSSDGSVRLWNFRRANNQTRFDVRYVMRGHEERVTCIAACKAWSMAVSGGVDGKVCFWDLNRGRFVRSVSLGSEKLDAVKCVSVMESTGHVAACTAFSLRLFTINGRLIADLSLSKTDPIHSLAFQEREYSHKGVLATGGDNGSVTLRTWSWRDRDDLTGSFEFETMRVLNSRDENSGRVLAVRFLGESLFSGDERGRVHSWDLPE